MEPTFADLIIEFGKIVQLKDMKLDQAGLCRVVLDERVNIDFEVSADGESLYIYSAMPPLDASVDVEFMKALLNANYALHRSCQSRFTYDENAHEYVLCEVIPRKGIAIEILEQILQNFARIATTWYSNCLRGDFSGTPKEKDQQDQQVATDYAPPPGHPPPFV